MARALGRLIVVLPRALDADLERVQRMSLSEYTALRHLSEAPDRRMRMSELAAACDMSLSGMTRLADKLQSLGFLDRVRSDRDARYDAGTGGAAGACTHRARSYRTFARGLTLRANGRLRRRDRSDPPRLHRSRCAFVD